MSHINVLREKVSPEVKEGEPLAKHTTFKIGGAAEYFFEAKSAEDAVKGIRSAGELGIPLLVLGGGSNMLVSDEGVKGLVIKMANRGFSIDGTTITAEAGAPTGLVSMRAAEAGLTGFEWAVGVPGTIGGAVRGNAGAYGGDMNACVTSVVAYKDGQVVEMSHDECGFSYRDSAFKRTPGCFVLAATIALKPAPDAEAGKAKLKQILLDRKEKQPVEFPTAGCMFTNWKPQNQEQLADMRKWFDLDKEEKIPMTAEGTVPAGWIIDRAQLKGTKVGHVQVSDKHGNFFVSDGKAKADDVVALTAVLKTRVRNMSEGNVTLHEEVEYVGF